MDLAIRSITADEWADWVRAVELAFHEQVDIAAREAGKGREVTELDRSFAAFDEDRIVATAGAHSFQMTVPGGLAVPTAGITAVGVYPTHRRRGLLRHLMRELLDQSHERGEPLAALYASESVIYGRFGYGVATFDGWYGIDRTRASLVRAPSGEGRLRIVGKEEYLQRAPEAYERSRLDVPGTLARTPAFWEHLWWGMEQDREGFSANFACLYEAAGRVDGYVVYQIKTDWSTALPADVLSVKELHATTDDAYLALWQFCFDIDLVARIEARLRPYDEPLRFMLTDPRRLETRFVSDGLWVRLVDLPAALAARRYATEGRLVVEVRDDFCPWNEGRWVLDAGPEGADCRPARDGEDADLACTSTELGSAYLGGIRLGTLARAGRVEELRAGALARGDALFGHDPLPAGSTQF